MTNPGGMDEYFDAMSSPATCMELPPAATTYALADPALAKHTYAARLSSTTPVVSLQYSHPANDCGSRNKKRGVADPLSSSRA
jgi:hypothetical protein